MKPTILSILLILTLSVSRAQTYYPIEECRLAYEQNMIETILPSLFHIKETAENGGQFDAREYFKAADLLCEIYIHHYKNPEYATKIMEQAHGTLLQKADSTHKSPTRLSALKLAEIHIITHQYDKAQKYISQSEKLFDIAKCNCDERVRLQLAKLELATVNKYTAQLPAEIKKTAAVYNKFHGDITANKDFLAMSANNKIAAAYLVLGDTVNAENRWKSIAESIKINNAKSNELSNSVINSLATIEMARHNWQAALDMYLNVKVYHDYYNALYFRNIVMCAIFSQRSDVAGRYFGHFNKEMYQSKARVFFRSTEENHLKTWAETVKDVDFYNFAAQKSRTITAEAFASSVFFKKLSVESHRIIDSYVQKSTDQRLKSAYQKCKEMKHKFIFELADSVQKMRYYAEYERLFDSIFIKADNFSRILDLQTKNIYNLRNSLTDNELIVEFCVIPDYSNYPQNTDYFGAYIIGKNSSTAKLIQLAETKQIEQLLRTNGDDVLAINQMYAKEKSSQLYNLIFKPLVANIRPSSTIYYSPYGMLANINFDYLTNENGTPLNQKYKMVRVSSTSDIQKVKTRAIQFSKSAALFGNINYGDNSAPKTARRGIDFRNIPATKQEIDSVSKILNINKITTKIYDGDLATESAFKQLSGNSPEILHLATHGFYLDTKQKTAANKFAQNVNTYSEKESSMVLTGLALSNANRAWKGNQTVSGIEDGILTSFEISQLDLSNTRLAVLSACETAAGKIFPVDGVFGLQRAFKQAGAGSILMSLWKVDDEATAMFMESFYKFLFEFSDRHKALRLAQSEVRKEYSDPWYWAGWVLLD